MDIKNNLERAREQMKAEGIECLVLAPSTDLQYMTGFNGISLERPIFLMLTEKEALFLAPEFDLHGLSEELKETLHCIGWREDEDPYQKAKEYAGNDKIRAAAGNRMSAEMFFHLQKTFPCWEWGLGDQIMRPLRRKKTEYEYQCLKKAQTLSGRAFEKLLKEGLSGKTEKDAAVRLAELLKAEGLEVSGYPLVAAGENSAVVHHGAGDTLMKRGDVVVIDFGGCYEGYYSDITRTVVIGEEPEGFKELYTIVRQANEAAYEAARPGITAEELDRTAREVIEKSGYGMYFTHRLGHGIGRDIHEPPYIVEGNQERLEKGNTFSDEPGIYIPGRFGIRLEDVLFLKEDRAECLTELTHDYMAAD